jgi:CspA family cold shock protein
VTGSAALCLAFHLCPVHIGPIEHALVHDTAALQCVDTDVSIARFDVLRTSVGGDYLLALEAWMANGTVKWFNGQKGYGFIQPDEGGNDVFVHISAVERAGLSTLREGQKVGFETETGRNGKVAAVNLRPL